MKKKINCFLFFVFSSIFITLIFSSVVSGSLPVINLSKEVHLTDKAIEREIIIYNYFNESLRFDVSLYTGPFRSELLEDSFILPSQNTKTIKFLIYPIENSLDKVYTANIKVNVQDYEFIKDFKIHQNFNKTCNVLFDVETKRIEPNVYNIIFNLENQDGFNKNIRIIEDLEINLLEKDIFLSGNETQIYQTTVFTNKNNISIDYICNNVNESLEVSLDKGDGVRSITGFILLNNFLDSLFFKVLLVILLIVLVLSFATRFLIYLNKRKGF